VSPKPPTGAPPPLVLIHGEERHLVDAEARAWLDAARAQCSSDLNVEVIDTPAKLDQVRRSLAEMPFLDPIRYLMVRDPPQLTERARRGAEPAELLVAALEQRSETTSVCFVAHSTVAAGNAVLGAVRTLGGRISYHAPVKGRDLRAWLEERLRQAGLRVPAPAVAHLVTTSGGDLGVLDNEVAKLAAYAAGRTSLSLEEVARLAGGEEQVEVWAVLDRLLAPSPGRGAAAVDTALTGGVSTQYLIATLSGQIRDLMVAQELLEEKRGGPPALAAAMGVPPWRAERLARQAGMVPGEVLEGWLRELQRIDAEVKAGRLDDAAALRSFGLRAARDVSETTARRNVPRSRAG
jgi:DNA polymerase III subunit delta